MAAAWNLAGAASAAQQPGDARGETPVATARRATGPIAMDGRLHESDWLIAPSIGPLTQREPLQGQPATEDTEVRVLYDEEALYVGIVCHEDHPRGIVSTQLTRDANLDVDDRVTIVLDPFFDHRNGFFFQVNPAGARTDGQISDNAQNLIRDWDGIWDAAVTRSADGWTAEIAIPFKTLRFKPGQAVWGFNVERQTKHLFETDRWAAARVTSWIGNLADAGQLTGLEDARQGRGLDARPYVSGGRDTGDAQFAGGLDVFKNLTPNLNASITVNTDFAETEADIRQVNLTRFPLFFPEKRTFFLEGAGVFGVPGLASGTDLIPLFTRRIGLHGDEDTGGQVPIAAGAKIVGRQSDYNIGVLDVQTRRVPEAPLDPENLFAARLSRNLFQQSSIGAIVTNGNPEGSGRNNLIGADARFATSTFHENKNASLALFVQRTDDHASGVDYAGGFLVTYPNDRWDLWLDWKQIGERFQPALGFVPRAGIRKTVARVAFQPRPARWAIRQFFFEFEPEYITDLHNTVENWRLFTAPFNVRTESGEHLEWNFVPEFERLDAAFEISPGVVVPIGSYQWHRFRAEANTATKRRWVVDLTYWWGGLYDGTRRQTGAGLTLKPNAHVSMAVRVDRNDIALREGAFFTQVVTARLDYSFTPDVSWQNLQQYDNASRLLAFQSRFRWILKPGNDLFVVVNRGWTRTFDGGFESTFDRASSKLQYTFRF
ncbi:MAG: carbohydrate binding family 9 domain-containing protein [Acidobacteria bacterium]|nr:carbohydrate binding family 9 domain-containing protein [Acidobacteriota bacterium]